MTERSSSNHGMSQRFASWPTALIGIIIIKAALSLAVRPGSFLLSYSGISYFLLLVLATSFGIRNGKQTTLGSRPFWVFFAIACGLWSVNQLMQLWYEFVLHMESPSSSLADPILFLHIVPFMAALAAFPHRNLSDQKSHRAISDALLLLFFWSFLYSYIVFPYQYVAPTSYNQRFDMLYLAENLVLVSAAGILTLRARAPWKSIYLHLFGASLLYALSSAVANIAVDSGGYFNGKLYGLGLTASVCWFVWIPLRARQLSWAEAGATQASSKSTASSWAFVTVVVITIPIMWELLHRDETASMRTFRILVAIAAIVCLACAAYVREHLAKSELASRLGLADNRLHLAMKSGKCVGWDWDRKSGRDFWFGDLQTQFGIPSDTYVGRVEDFHRRVYPEDRERVAKAVKDAMQSRKKYTAEFRLLRPDGTIRWVSAEGEFYYAANGEPQRMLGISVDITDRKRAEEALRESDERLRLAAEAGRMYAYEWDAATDTIVRSPEATKILGLTREPGRITRQQLVEEVHPEDRATFVAAVTGLTPKDPFAHLSYRLWRPGGRVMWLEKRARAFFDEQGRIQRMIGMVADVTDRKQIEEALKKSEEKFVKAFRASPVGLGLISVKDSRFLEVNDTFEHLTGYRRDEAVGRTSFDLGLWADPSEREGLRKELLSKDSLRDVEARFRTKDGNIRVGLFSVDLIEIEGESCALVVAQDITERKLAEEALARMSRRVIDAEEYERNRIAKDLHEDIGQRLALLAIEIELLKTDPPQQTAEMLSRMDTVWKETLGILTDVKTSAHELHSPRLEYLSLEAVMRSFCEEFGQRRGVEIHFRSQDLPDFVSPDISLCLFRVLQEALYNAVKHSGVRHFEVELWGRSSEVHLAVSDSGAGFDLEATKNGPGIGLIGMQERLQLLKGTFSIESQPKHGSTIHARVPLNSERESTRAVV